MAYYSIDPRKKADGTTRYRCIVRIKEKGKTIFQDSRTFTKKTQAKAWGSRRAVELETQGDPGKKVAVPTIRELIRLYEDDPNLGGKSGRSKKFALKMIADCDIASVKADKLTEKDLVDFCKDRAAAGAGPVTVRVDISSLRSILKAARPVFGIDVDDTVIGHTLSTLHDLKLIGKSQKRSRRPTSIEIDLILEGLKKREEHRENKIPFCDILSILSCMRIGEVCKLRWEDLDESKKRILVHDRKDPRKKEGNYMYVPLLGGAFDIVKRQSRTDERIFPHNERSVTAGFQRVRKKIAMSNSEHSDISSLRYHDLRREGASRLFEMGFSIEEVAQVTGHRSLNILWRVYTELNSDNLHSKFEQASGNI